MEGVHNIQLGNYILLFSTLVQKTITVIVSMFIVLNLIIRSFVPGEVLYPHNASRMPYVQNCRTKMREPGTGFEFCHNAKNVDNFKMFTDSATNPFTYIETDDKTNTPYVIGQNEVSKKKLFDLFAPKSLYLSSSFFQNIGMLSKKNFTYLYSPLFLAYLVTIRSQRQINKLLSILHNTLFSSSQYFRVLFIILTMLMVVMMDNVYKDGSSFDLLNEAVGIKSDDFSFLGYIIKLVYTTFGGFVVFFKLLSFLLAIFLLIIILEYVSANTPINMMVSKIMAVCIAASIGTSAASFASNPGNMTDQLKSFMKDFPSLISFKNQSPGTIFIRIIMFLIMSFVLYSGALSIIPIIFAGLFTILQLSYDLGVKWLFNSEIRNSCIRLFKTMLPAVKLIIMIFSIDVINQTLGNNASILSIVLFILFLMLDYFNSDKSVSSDTTSLISTLVKPGLSEKDGLPQGSDD
jgi:hypothetical protein